MAMLTVAVEVVAVLPKASWRTTTGWVVKATFLVAPPGWVVKASLVAAPGFTVNVLLVPATDPPDWVAVMVVLLWTLVIVTLWGSSTPFVKAVVVPLPEERVAFEVMTTLLFPPLKLVTVLPN
jgi:hypothetical protein